MAYKKNNGWLVTIAVSAGIAVIAAKFSTQIKELVKDLPVIGDFINS